MRLFILTLLFSSSVFASELSTLIEKKHQNYLALRKHYSTLLGNVTVGKDQLFCDNVRNIYPTLSTIFEDDQQLIAELRRSEAPEYREYAQTIDDNSRSPLFSYTAYTDLCEQNNRETILRLGQSLQYHVMNIDYLSMSNLLFWQAIPTRTLN